MDKKKVVFMIPTENLPEKSIKFPSVYIGPNSKSAIQKKKCDFPIFLAFIFVFLIVWVSISVVAFKESPWMRGKIYFGETTTVKPLVTENATEAIIASTTTEVNPHPLKFVFERPWPRNKYFRKPWLNKYHASSSPKPPVKSGSIQSHERSNHHHPLDLKFLNHVNRHRLHDSEYHVITMFHYEKNETYVMHLKKSGMTLLVDETLKYDDKMDCVYSGHIVSSRKGEYVGTASLSSCHHEIALEGLVTLRNVHYHLTPSQKMKSESPFLADRDRISRTERSNGKSVKKHVVTHQLTRARASSSSSSSYRRKDSKRVPPNELRRAQEQMLKDQEALEDEDDDDDDEDNEVNSDPENIQQAFSLDSISDSGGNDDALDEVAFAGQVTRNRKPAKARLTTRKKKTIELAIFTDPQFYQKWASDFPKNTQTKMNQFLLAMVNNMNFLYAQPSMKEKVNFRLVQIRNMKTAPAGLDITPSADNYLDSFCAWAGKLDKNGAVWDHAMMVSGYDLLDDKGTTGNLGIAFTSTMCLRNYSCSLIEYVKGFETTYTATHEVGHSLGMLHDGEDYNRDCDESKYLMAALAGKGQITWSDCSNKNIRNFLATGDPEPGTTKPSYMPRCLHKKSSKRTSVIYKRGKFPGQIFDTRGQCKKACEGCVPHITKDYPYNNICWMLHCTSPTIGILDAHPALEGTVCAANKRCRAGRCV